MGAIGEVSFDFAEYAEATKPSSVSLPLKTSNTNSNAVLHVSSLFPSNSNPLELFLLALIIHG